MIKSIRNCLITRLDHTGGERYTTESIPLFPAQNRLIGLDNSASQSCSATHDTWHCCKD